MPLIQKPLVAETLSVSLRTIDNYARRHETNRQEVGNPALPSSPGYGLYSIRLPGGHRRFDPRDVDEYIRNAANEQLGLPLENWRAKSRKQPAICKAGASHAHP